MGLEELEAAWNANADRFNQWSELGIDEIVAFAQEVEREAWGMGGRRHGLGHGGHAHGGGPGAEACAAGPQGHHQ